MIIVAGGDSFIWGSELKDERTSGKTWNTFSRLTFTSLLAKSNNMHYECVALPGNSNQAITRQTMNYCESHKDIKKFVIINWTFPNRYEFRFPFVSVTNPLANNHWESISAWTIKDTATIKEELKSNINKTFEKLVEYKKSISSNGIDDFAKNYFKHVGMYEYWEIYTSLQSIVMMQNYLELNNIPYMFSMAEDVLLKNYTIDNPDQSISTLSNQLKMDNWFMFPDSKGFYQWALENKYPVGDTHPLEEAHYDAAQLMKDKFNELVEKFNKQN